MGDVRVHENYIFILEPAIERSEGRDSSKNLDTGAEADTVGDHHLLLCSLWLAQLSSVHSPGTFGQGWHCQQWAGTFHINWQLRNWQWWPVLFQCRHPENVLPKWEAQSFHARCSISGSLTNAKLKCSTAICQQINWSTVTIAGNQEHITQHTLATWNKLSSICQHFTINFLIEGDKSSK